MFQPADDTAADAAVSGRLADNFGGFSFGVVKHKQKQTDNGGKLRRLQTRAGRHVQNVGNVVRLTEANLFVQYHGGHFVDACQMRAAAG